MQTAIAVFAAPRDSKLETKSLVARMSEDTWAYQFISAYHLRKDDVEGFLTRQFGEVEFFIQVHSIPRSASPRALRLRARLTARGSQLVGDKYRFWIERPLTRVCLTDGDAFALSDPFMR